MCLFFFFKQKTAYEMRISDWSSDVCSSDLFAVRPYKRRKISAGEKDDGVRGRPASVRPWRYDGWLGTVRIMNVPALAGKHRGILEIGRASCRESVCQYV